MSMVTLARSRTPAGSLTCHRPRGPLPPNGNVPLEPTFLHVVWQQRPKRNCQASSHSIARHIAWLDGQDLCQHDEQKTSTNEPSIVAALIPKDDDLIAAVRATSSATNAQHETLFSYGVATQVTYLAVSLILVYVT